MKKSNLPLDDDELEVLQDILIERIDEHEDTTGKDEGITLLDELDGFLTALVSGPVGVLPSVWMPVLWGDYPPDWQSPQQPAYALQLMRRLQNEIASTLLNEPEFFEPYFSWYELEGQRYEIVEDWCEGYMRGVRLFGTSWEDGHPQVTALLEPLRAFCMESWHGDDLEPLGSDEERAAIVPNVRALHRYWLQRRQLARQG